MRTTTATEFTFHLRQGVTFHDGTPFNAAAVKVNLERVTNPENHLTRRSLRLDGRSHVDVVDPYTVKIVLTTAVRRLREQHGASGHVHDQPEGACSNTARTSRRNPVGTGPFKFVSFATDTREGRRRTRLTGSPACRRWTASRSAAVPENGARFAMLQTGRSAVHLPACRRSW